MGFLGDAFSGIFDTALNYIEAPINAYNAIEDGHFGDYALGNLESDATLAADIFSGGATAPLFAAIQLGEDASNGANTDQLIADGIGGVVGAYGAVDGAGGGFADSVVSGDFDQAANAGLQNFENFGANAIAGAENAGADVMNIPSDVTTGIQSAGNFISSLGDSSDAEAGIAQTLGQTGQNAFNQALSGPSGLINEEGSFLPSSGSISGSDIFNQSNPDTALGAHYLGAPVIEENNGIEQAGVYQSFNGSNPNFVPYSQFESDLGAGNYGAVSGEQGFSNLASEENIFNQEAQTADSAAMSNADQAASDAQSAYFRSITPTSGSDVFAQGTTGDQVSAGDNTASAYAVPVMTPGQAAAVSGAGTVPTGGAGGAAGTPSFLGTGQGDVNEGSINNLGTGGSNVDSEITGDLPGISNSTPSSISNETSPTSVTGNIGSNVTEQTGGSDPTGSPSAPTTDTALADVKSQGTDATNTDLNGQSSAEGLSGKSSIQGSANVDLGSQPANNSILSNSGPDNSFNNPSLNNPDAAGYTSNLAGNLTGAKMPDSDSVSSLMNTIGGYAKDGSALAGLGSGIYGLIKGNSTPQAGNLQAVGQQQERISDTDVNYGNSLINESKSGQLDPGTQGIVNTDVASKIQQIKSQYASMGLAGSTMEQQDIANAQSQGSNETAQLLQSLGSEGLQALTAGSGALQAGTQDFADIGTLEAKNDEGLNSSLEEFAKSLGLLDSGLDDPNKKNPTAAAA